MPFKYISAAKDYLLSSAGWRAAFNVVVPVATGVFSGAYINEITSDTAIKWEESFSCFSFYCLVVLTFLSFAYARCIYLRETEIERFQDPDFCMAYLRSKCLPEAAEKFKQQIRSGDGKDLAEISKEVKKFLQ